jgi:prepilin-type N-terminal cleavage/methylation domain-containing protein/prepilin-type processing-associated H-X9-DG protein
VTFRIAPRDAALEKRWSGKLLQRCFTRADQSRILASEGHAMRRGFTIIELLIVVFLIGLLVALAAPAILTSRDASRQATCLNRQREVMLAVQSFEQAKARFPGWREQLGAPGTWKTVSWQFSLLPYLERQDLYRAYTPGGALVAQEPTELVSIFVCPADDVGNSPTPSSYAANCGVQDWFEQDATAPPDFAANGIFHDTVRSHRGARRTQCKVGDMRDGARNTLAMTDRAEVVNWIDWQKEQRIGIWWQNALDPPSPARINGLKPPLTESKDWMHVRPSSFHSGGVVAMFADGHGQFLSENLDYLVYALLMTPDGSKARMPNGDPVLAEIRTSTLPEGALAE